MNRRRIVLLFAVIALISVSWIFIQYSAGPRSGGRTLNYWLREYALNGTGDNYNPARLREVGFHLRQMGTGILPELVHRSYDTNQVSAVRSNLMRFLARNLPRSWGFATPISADTRRTIAQDAIRDIRPPAKILLPLLQERWKSTNQATRVITLLMLGSAGRGAEAAAPILSDALKDPDFYARMAAISSLKSLGPAAVSAIPDLIEVMRSRPSLNELDNSIGVLAAIGSNAAPAIPLIQDLFTGATSTNQKAYYAVCLCRIDAGQTNALAYLMEGLKPSRSVGARRDAASRLGQIGPNGSAAAPLLIAALEQASREGDEPFRNTVSTALKNMGAPPDSFLPKMKDGMKSTDPRVRLRTAIWIIQLEPSDRDSQAELLKQATEGSPDRFTALQFLGGAGPAAKDTTPALRELLKSSDPRLRTEAAEALRIIEAKEPPK